MKKKITTQEQFAKVFEALPTNKKMLIAGAEHYGRKNVNSISGFLRGGDGYHGLLRPVVLNVPKYEREIVWWCAYGKCRECYGD